MEPQKYLYCVSSFTLDSGGRSHVSLNVYDSLESASEAYEELKKTLCHDCCYDEDKDEGQRIVETIDEPQDPTQIKSKAVWEDGSWKRPSGYELLIIPLVDKPVDLLNRIYKPTEKSIPLPLYSFYIQAWPKNRTY